MAYPNTIDSPDTSMQGTTLVATDDHALNHRTLGSSLIATQNLLGTTSASNGLFNAFTAGQTPLPIQSGTLGQTISKGTINNGIFGSASLTSGTIGTAQLIGGTANSLTLGTPSVDVLNARNSGTALGFGNSMYPAVGTITDVAGGTFTVNAQQAQIYYCAMGTSSGNRTVTTPTNISPYQQLTYAFKTSGSANGTLVWGTVFRISQDFGTPTLGTGVGWNMYSWRYNAVDSKFDFIGQVKNLI